MRRAWILSFLSALLIALGTTVAVAAVSVEDVDFGGTPNHALGRYRVPIGVPVPKIAFLSIHRTADNRNHTSVINLANRGFGTLGIRTRFGNSEAAVDFEQIAFDIRNGVRFLRAKGHTKIILIGHSGGGPSTSFYQAVMEAGVSYCKGKNKITECPFTGAEFTPADKADGILFPDAHPGIGVNQLRSLNGSVMNEDYPFHAVNPTLDPWDPAFGYNEAGDSSYSDDFVARYTHAQSIRMNKIINDAQQLRKKIAMGLVETPDPNDLTKHPFPLYRANARLVQLTTGVMCCTQQPRRLLQDATGTPAAPAIVHTVRVPTPDIRLDDQDPGTFEDLSLGSFLSANAIQSKNSLDESQIDWCTTNNSTPCAAAQIHVPALVMTMQGHYFMRDGEYIYERLASPDKEYLVVQGATHGLGNCGNCPGGPYLNVSANIWNYVAAWANAPGRF
jgi:hypothetical protein